MRLLTLTLAVLALSPGAAQAGPRIVGGTGVAPGTYPWVAKIDIEPGLKCTGTLIAPGWVMTAGHCSSLTGVALPTPIPLIPELYTVTLGGVKTDGSDGTEHTVKAVHLPPSYSADNGSGSDVGLLELTDPSTAVPLKLAAEGERSIWEPGDTVTAAGYGVTESDGEQPDTLQAVDVFVVDDATCAGAYDDFDAATEFCAGVPEGGKDSCQGDSGGPLMGRTAAGDLRLVGATSRGEGCAQAGFPGVYARVAEGPMRAFVKGLVPDAFAAEPAPSASPSPAPGAPAATATPVPVTAASACGKRLRLRVRRSSAGVRIRVDGRTVLRRKGKTAGFRFRIGPHLERADGTAIVKVTTYAPDGRKRTTTRLYRNCAKLKP